MKENKRNTFLYCALKRQSDESYPAPFSIVVGYKHYREARVRPQQKLFLAQFLTEAKRGNKTNCLTLGPVVLFVPKSLENMMLVC